MVDINVSFAFNHETNSWYKPSGPVSDGRIAPTLKGFLPTPTLAPDRKAVYVSISEGNDSNSGLSELEPKATIAAAVALLNQSDHLLLKAGDWWQDEGIPDRSLPSGRSATDYTVIGWYGSQSDDRPIMEPIGGFHRELENVFFTGVCFWNWSADPDNPSYVPTTYYAKSNFLSLDQNDFIRNIIFNDTKHKHSALHFQGVPDYPCSDIILRRNIHERVYEVGSSDSRSSKPSLQFIRGTVGLEISEAVHGRGGWDERVNGAGANLLSHNIYLQFDVVDPIYVNSISLAPASHGIQMRKGGVAENNFFARCAVGFNMGYDSYTWQQGDRAYVYDNIVSEFSTQYKGFNLNYCDNSSQTVCTGASWGTDIKDPDDTNLDLRYGNNLYYGFDPTDELINGAIEIVSALRNNNQPYSASDSSYFDADSIIYDVPVGDFLPAGVTYVDAGRTAGDYFVELQNSGVVAQLETLGVIPPFVDQGDNFKNYEWLVYNRKLGQWHHALTNDAIQEFIRSGFVPV